jgi:hypothetical protein
MLNPEKSKWFESGDGYMCVYSITSQASCDTIDAFIQMIRAIKRQDRVPLILVGTLGTHLSIEICVCAINCFE